ncbi:pentapeptide repeat-containing protein [Sciscionella sediminilitoris]|uniref:pentapeptide repeat-containing protein n=1 Tax=Sciscionella sediminilitoris TaxID=1445613 RepID=UPI0018D11BA8|nr:pentapeptide repeat-containing protein [Sciscionella sp. SE31]
MPQLGQTIGRRRLFVLSVAAVLSAVAVCGGLIVLALMLPVPADRLSAVLDAVKIGLSVLAGLGGLFGLYLAWRRQRAIETDHDRQERALEQQRTEFETDRKHRENVAAQDAADALSRRITEQYTKAVEQLGAEGAAVRLGGLYALERLAQENPEQRGPVVKLCCAYLRMAYTPPAIGLDEEGQVRVGVQEVLSRHLQPKMSESYWPDTTLNLRGATLYETDFSRCEVETADFRDAKFYGQTNFTRSEFYGANFTGAEFRDRALFDYITCKGRTGFTSAQFAAVGSFVGATLLDANFELAKFQVLADFSDANFLSWGLFTTAHFELANFSQANFEGNCSFRQAEFVNTPLFRGAFFALGPPEEVLDYL